jgi:hypothetical protein
MRLSVPLRQFFNHAKTQRFFAAGDPKDSILVEHAQMHEVNEKRRYFAETLAFATLGPRWGFWF